MKTKTNCKAGGWTNNHNETLMRDTKPANLKVKTRVRAGTREAPTESIAFVYQRM